MAGKDFKPYGRVYLVTNLVNGKKYVGQTVLTLEKRWQKHCSVGSRCNALLAAITKYGRHSFSVMEIATAQTKAELDAMESCAVDAHQSLAPHGYNLRAGGQSRGKLTDAMKDHLRRVLLEKWKDAEYRERLVSAHRTPEYIGRTSEIHKARTASPEARAVLKERASSPEFKAKVSAASRANWARQEYREQAQRMLRALAPRSSAAMKERWASGAMAAALAREDVRLKHTAAVAEAVRTPEARARQGEIMKARWADPEARALMMQSLQDTNEKRIAAIKLAYEKEEVIEQRRAKAAAMWSDEEFQKKMRSPEMVKKRSEAASRGNTTEARAKNSATQKARWLDPEYRAMRLAQINTPEAKAKKADASRRRWEKYRAEQSGS